MEPLFPKLKGWPGKDNGRFLEAVYWIVRADAPWQDLLPEFGFWKTVYNRYNH
ncbi:MAG: transposase [Candidatus Symbiodolus clandestinus]